MTEVDPFTNVISTEWDFREIVGEPSQLVIDKALPKLDLYSAGFIARSPFALVANLGPDWTLRYLASRG